ncbi:hypothetical protein PTKIN_Ptkin01aG0074400 [Pterospermum kingtungense]
MPIISISTAKVAPINYDADQSRKIFNYDADQIRKIFLACDIDGNKVLSRDEIKLAFDRLGAYIPAYRAWRALQHADFNNDGCISMEELNDLVAYASRLGYRIK